MMRITISERLHPFSHLPGTLCVLPRTSLRFQIFPALIRIHDLSDTEPKSVAEISLPIKGPVSDFTIELDLEHGAIHVWGHSSEGYFRYKIVPTDTFKSYLLLAEKGISFPETDQQAASPIGRQARLSVGNHKKQDWELVSKRGDLAEIFPIWFALGRTAPEVQIHHVEGTATLLERGLDLGNFQQLFQAGFEGILSPRLKDESYLGLDLKKITSTSHQSPLVLLSEGAKLIQRLFVEVEEKEKRIHILPALPSPFHAGRLVDFPCGECGDLDLEWTKKIVRRLSFQAKFTGKLTFIFTKEISSFRLHVNGKNSGRFSADSTLDVELGKKYDLDNIQK